MNECINIGYPDKNMLYVYLKPNAFFSFCLNTSMEFDSKEKRTNPDLNVVNDSASFSLFYDNGSQ